jgi:hypothetical protein
LRKIKTNLRIADVLANIQTQHVPNMGLEHRHYARLLVSLATAVLSMYSESPPDLQTALANGCEYRRSYKHEKIINFSVQIM